MSLLPFTTIFILIISLCSMGLFQGYKSTTYATSAFTTYLDSFTSVTNSIEATYFKKIKTIKNESELNQVPGEITKNSPPSDKKQPNQEQSNSPSDRGKEIAITCSSHLTQVENRSSTHKKSPRSDKTYITFRIRNQSDNSKLNIAKLFTKKDPILEQALIHLIDDFYQDTPAFQDIKIDKGNLSANLVKALIKNGKKLNPEDLTLNRIDLQSPQLQKVWHKILQGTRNYNLKDKTGWPPLSHFVLIDIDPNHKPICIKKTSIPVLKAFFGEAITEMILKEEKEKFYSQPNKPSPLSKAEFEKFLERVNFTHVKNYIDYQYNKKTQTVLSHMHSDTGVIADRIMFEGSNSEKFIKQ